MTWVLAAAAWLRAGPESLVLILLIGVVLTWLVWRWQKSGTVMRCVMVSLLAHLLLLLYASHIQWAAAPHGAGGGMMVIRLRDDGQELSLPQESHDASAATPASELAADGTSRSAAPATADDQSGDNATSSGDQSTTATAVPEQTSGAAVQAELAREASRALDEHPQALPPPEIVGDDAQPPFPAETQPVPATTRAASATAARPAPSPPQALETLSGPPPELAPQPPTIPPTLPVEPLPAAAWMPHAVDLPSAAVAASPGPHDPPPFELLRQPPSTTDRPVPAAVSSVLMARLAPDRLAVGQRWGATPHSEAAVAAALDWLARTQSPDGRWNAAAFGAGRETRTLGHDRQGAGARADTGITALALLAFLGTGQTHQAGMHQDVVRRGLAFLMNSQAADGSLAGTAELFAAMYCHGMASLALAEAYALTGDKHLLPAVRRALDYTLGAQHVLGGWRYQPHDPGDMSQFGWQVMALKAGQLGGLPLPETAEHRMRRFLRSCAAGPQGGLASYRPGERPSRTMSAEALVCRWLLEEDVPPGARAEATAYLLEELPGQGPANFYYWYYGTLALFPQQGSAWQRWNVALQRELLQRQRREGWMAGSWDPSDLWGGYGGRVYSTALAALCLEVYYRYLPHEDASPPSRLTDRLLVPPVPR